MKLKHRDSQKRFYFEDGVYFITTNTKERFPFFQERIFCDLFVENLKLCKKLKQFKLYGWVLCFDHFHWLIQPNDEFNYSKIMQFFKRHVNRNVNWIMGNNDEPIDTRPYEGAIGQSRLQLGKFNEKLRMLKAQFLQKYPNHHSFPQFQWHKSFHDHFIRDEDDFMNHLEYIEYNLIKHNLPKGWPYIYINPKYKDLLNDY